MFVVLIVYNIPTGSLQTEEEVSQLAAAACCSQITIEFCLNSHIIWNLWQSNHSQRFVCMDCYDIC